MGAADSIREELEKKNEYILFLQEENKRLSETLASLVETIAKTVGQGWMKNENI